MDKRNFDWDASFCDIDRALFVRLPVEAIHFVLRLEKEVKDTFPILKFDWDYDVDNVLERFFQ